MNESVITFQGWLGGDVTLRRAGSSPVANFRVASTPRRFRRSTGEWVDGPTQWYTVNAWRALGEHCARSLRRGDPVVVQGRLTTSTYVNKHDVEVTSLDVEAIFVGHDLNRGQTTFTRVTGHEAVASETAGAADAPGTPAGLDQRPVPEFAA